MECILNIILNVHSKYHFERSDPCSTVNNNCWRSTPFPSFFRITDAHTQWCRIANPTQLKRCPYGQEYLSRRELSRICNPAPLNIRICNPRNTVFTFFPHHRCSYSMVSDCKSDTTSQLKIRHNRHNDTTTQLHNCKSDTTPQRRNTTTDTTQICPVSIHQYIKKP